MTAVAEPLVGTRALPQVVAGTRTLPQVVAGTGSLLRTADGRVVLDACSGAVNVNIGHGHPRVLAAMRRQMEQVSFVYRSHFDTPPGLRLRQRLTELTGGAYPGHVFTNSGSEAVEQALRLAWRIHEVSGEQDRHVVLTETPGYHGMTLGALAASGHNGRREAVFPQWLDSLRRHVRRVHAPDEPGGRADAAAWRAAIERAGDTLAAVVIEPVGGAAGGAAASTPATLAAIREAATAAGALVISDEVMTGFGRLGQWCPSLDRGLDADIVVASKGLGAGYHPIGAVLLDRAATATLDGLPDGGTFGHTMAGNPVAAATACAVLDELDEARLLDHVLDTGPVLDGLLRHSATEVSCLGPARGEGYLFAVAVHHPAMHAGDAWRACGGRARERAPGSLLAQPVDDQQLHDATALAGARAFAACALAEDLLVYPSGTDCCSASVLVAPPLNADTTTLHEIAARLTAAARRFERTSPR
jgi:adenosylmethionine-8-amino-7-oxononanoate aminotransferase